MAQSFECLTLAQVMISWLVGSCLMLGSVRTAQSLKSASDSMSPSLPAPLPLTLGFCLSLSLSLSQNKHNKKKFFFKWAGTQITGGNKLHLVLGDGKR